MIYTSRYHFNVLEPIVYNMCQDFILARGLSYFHFRRNYQDGSSLVLTNNGSFLSDFLDGSSKEISYPVSIPIHQSWICFWDECPSEELIALTREKHKLYHGVTIINRHKEYYDCAAFAMPAPHPSPSSHYLNIFHDLKAYSELFPKMAEPLIRKIKSQRIQLSPQRQDKNRKFLFLPQKSKRIYIGIGPGSYITTYELFCLQLLYEGKTYQEIGSILSMSARTVETHLTRLKSRTRLTANDLLAKSLKIEALNVQH